MNELATAETALEVLGRAAGYIGEDQVDYPTPCRDYDITALAGHLVDSVTRISAAAGVVVTVPAGETIARAVDAGREAVAGWRRRGIDGDVFFAGRTMAARDLLGVIGLEFVVHAWDLATAVGEPLDVPDDLAADTLKLARRTITAESRRNAGFAEPVVIGAGASAFDRLLAYTGRNPAMRTLLR